MRAFENGVGDPNLSTILIGARGSGKTALMSLLAHEAQGSGGFRSMFLHFRVCLRTLPSRRSRCFQHSVRFLACEDQKRWGSPNSRYRMGEGCGRAAELAHAHERDSRRLNASDVGLLITVDEVRADLDELIQLVSVHQHFIREGRKVALLLAGLPGEVSSLLQDRSVSFFRRACQHHLGRIEDYEIALAMKRTIETRGNASRSARSIRPFGRLVGFLS